MTTIFVFGSNERGVHGAGAARTARLDYGACPGVGRGPTGNAYAIPTKRTPSRERRQIPLQEIAASVAAFLVYAREHPADTFIITPIGCGLAGYTDTEIAPMFQNAPSNCQLPSRWRSA